MEGYFNPHTREGCDGATGRDDSGVRAISIHTPVKGVTTIEAMIWDKSARISIHTPVKGVTPGLPRLLRDIQISIHTPVKGVTVDRPLGI